MSKWVHLSINFKDYNETFRILNEDASQVQPKGPYRELIRYLKKVVEALSPDLIDRYFYFFEPNPHLFLSLELKEESFLKEVEDVIKGIPRPSFVDTAEINITAEEGGGARADIDFFQAGAGYAFFRVSDEYKSIYDNNDIAKLVHCFCNQQLVERSSELMFYVKRLQDNGLPIYAQKQGDKITLGLKNTV